jgi:hypothetical protein
MADDTELHIGDKVVVLNVYGLRIEGKIVAIDEEHGLKTYRVASENFALSVPRRQIIEVHR